jgi:hypothetical protein
MEASGQRIGRIDYHPFGNAAATGGKVDFRTCSIHAVEAESGSVPVRGGQIISFVPDDGELIDTPGP